MRPCLLLALFAPFASSQSLFPTQPDAAQIDALVTNAQGLPVTSLTAADFAILRNNQPQKILSAAYVRTERTVLFVVDDLNLSLDTINAVRAALGKFVDEQLQPADRAAIMRTGSGSSAMQAFTADKNLLHAAIDQVKCYPARIAGGADEPGQTNFATGSRAAIRFAAGGLPGHPGRKAVVVLSSNLGMFRNALDSAGRLIEVANHAGAVLYGFDPSPGADPAAAASFMVLAEETGGAVIPPETGLAAALARALQEQDGYYLIDFRPDASLTPQAEKLSLRVKPDGLTARSRTGSMVKPGETPEPWQKPRRAQLLQAVADPASATGIRTRLTTIFINSAQGSQVEALAHIDARDLGFIHYLNGVHHYGLDVLILVCDEDGRIVQEGSRTVYVDMFEADYRHAVTNGLVFALNLPLWLPGNYQVRAVAGDAISGRIGSASQFLEVPDVRGSQFSLSSILLMGENSTSPLSKPPGIQFDVTGENPAVRVFNPGDKIVYGYEVLNAAAGEDKKPAIEARTRLFRNGSVVFEGKPALLAITPGEDPKRHYLNGKIALSTRMEPGDYVFEVTVTDRLAPGPIRKDVQFADFRVER